MQKYFPTPNCKIEIHLSKINLIGDIRGMACQGQILPLRDFNYTTRANAWRERYDRDNATILSNNLHVAISLKTTKIPSNIYDKVTKIASTIPCLQCSKVYPTIHK